MATCPTCGVKVPSAAELCALGSCFGCHDEGLCPAPEDLDDA